LLHASALIASLILAGVAGAEGAPESQALEIGAPMPMADVKMKNVDGKELSLEDVKGAKGTLVVFSCNHCPYAKAWEKRIVELGNTFPKKGVGVIVINPNDPETFPADDYESMQARAKERGMKFPYVVDATSDLARAFGATHTPEAFLFDKSGTLVYHGAVDDAKEAEKVKERYLKNAMTAVASGKPVALAETKSIGCGIKFRPKA
jgi:peroxiredoxin